MFKQESNVVPTRGSRLLCMNEWIWKYFVYWNKREDV
jgi:hypothetical protein